METQLLPPGWILRPPQLPELHAVTDLIADCDLADFGSVDYTSDDLLAEWRRPGFDLATNAYLLVAPDGRLAGYTDFMIEQDEIYISHTTILHPAFRDRLDIAVFYQLGEEFALRHFAGRQGLLRTISVLDERDRLLESRGYVSTRVDWRMEIELSSPPPVPAWPEGFQLRAFNQAQDARPVHETIQIAFRDLTNHADQPFENWEQFMLNRADFDPTLMFLVEKDGLIAGVAACFDYPTGGWVRQLAVRKEHRGRGLGLALLHQAFGEFYQRGKRSAGLIVDSQNPTGAPQFYLSAGMHPAQKIVYYQKTVLGSPLE